MWWNETENQKLQVSLKWGIIRYLIWLYCIIRFKYRKFVFLNMTKILVKFVLSWSKFQFFGWLLKKLYKPRINALPNFFSKVPTESGMLCPKIALWYFLKSKNLQLNKKIKEGFFWQAGWISFCSKYCQNC